MAYGILPALVGGAVVGVVLGDIAVDPGERELLVGRRGHGLHDELRVAVGRLGVVALAVPPVPVAGLAHVARLAALAVAGTAVARLRRRRRLEVVMVSSCQRHLKMDEVAGVHAYH